MANDRMIRKKFTTTVCDVLVVDLDTEQSAFIKVTLRGRHRFNEQKLLREVQRQLPKEVKAMKITGIEIFGERRIMSEQFFINNSEKEN